MQGRTKGILLVLAAIALVAVVNPAAIGTNAYELFDSSRQSTVDVTGQDTGILDIVAQASVKKGTTNQKLVEITNPQNADQTVTVTLDSTKNWQFSSTGTKTRTVTIAPGQTVQFNVDVANNADMGTATYQITAQSSGDSFTQSRSVEIKNKGGGGCGSPPCN